MITADIARGNAISASKVKALGWEERYKFALAEIVNSAVESGFPYIEVKFEFHKGKNTSLGNKWQAEMCCRKFVENGYTVSKFDSVIKVRAT